MTGLNEIDQSNALTHQTFRVLLVEGFVGDVIISRFDEDSSFWSYGLQEIYALFKDLDYIPTVKISLGNNLDV